MSSRGRPGYPQSGQSYEPYRDNTVPRSGSHADLQDYWDDGALPPAHRLSGTGSAYPPSTHSSTEALPLQERTSPYRDMSASQTHLVPSDPNPYPPPLARQQPAYPPPAAKYDSNDGGLNQSEWIEKDDPSPRRSRKWIIIAVVVVVLAIIAAVVAGVLLSRHSSSSSSSSGSSSGGGSALTTLPGSAGVVQFTNPSDPSTYVKDPALHTSFYGFAYEPLGVQLPECGAVQNNVTEDVILLSQLTTRIRLYGADCNMSALVLQGVQDSQVNLDVWLAIYVTDNETDYEVQRDLVIDAIQTYGPQHVAGVAVGNEFILDNLTALNENDPNSTAGIEAADYLISLMADTRTKIQALGLSTPIPVGTADAGSMLTPHLLDGADFGMANVHPWFGSVAIDQAAAWTWEFFEQWDVAAGLATSNKPTMYIAETGWPTGSSTAAAESDGPSNASVANLQVFLDTFVCQADQNGTNYFFFEYFDEPWKNVTFGGVEGYWGLFTANKQLKAVTIPTCSS